MTERELVEEGCCNKSKEGTYIDTLIFSPHQRRDDIIYLFIFETGMVWPV